MQFRSARTQSFRHILIRAELFQIVRRQVRQKMQTHIQRRLWILRQVLHHHVALHKIPVLRNNPQHFLRHIGHRREILNLQVRQPRRLQHAALHDLVGVADQQHARPPTPDTNSAGGDYPAATESPRWANPPKRASQIPPGKPRSPPCGLPPPACRPYCPHNIQKVSGPHPDAPAPPAAIPATASAGSSSRAPPQPDLCPCSIRPATPRDLPAQARWFPRTAPVFVPASHALNEPRLESQR